MNTTANAQTFGYTLTAVNKGQGSVKIHRAGCADIKKAGRGASIWTIEARSQQEVVEDVYADMLDSGEYTDWTELTGDIEYMHCCPRLAVNKEAAASTDTEVALPQPITARPARKGTDQAAIILAFFAAHAGTAYTPHQVSVATGHKGLRDACARLARQGVLIKASDKPVSYMIAG